MNAKQIGLMRLNLINARNTVDYTLENFNPEHPEKDIENSLMKLNAILSVVSGYLKGTIEAMEKIQNDFHQYEKEQTK